MQESVGIHLVGFIVDIASGVPRNFVRGGSTNSVEDRGQGTERTGIWGR